MHRTLFNPTDTVTYTHICKHDARATEIVAWPVTGAWPFCHQSSDYFQIAPTMAPSVLLSYPYFSGTICITAFKVLVVL